MYVEFTCPPMPHLIVAGQSIFRPGDIHEGWVLTDIFDLIVVQKGTLYMQEDDYQYSLKPGDYLILSPNKRHRGFRPCLEETHFSWVHFSTKGSYQLEYSSKMQKRKRMNHKKYYKKDDFSFFVSNQGGLDANILLHVLHLIERLAEVQINHLTREKRFFVPNIGEFEAQQTCLTILSELRPKEAVETDQDLSAQMYSYIESHANQPFSLNDLSETFSYHKSYIIQLIKKHYQITPAQLHNRFRLEAAKNLLQKTAMSIQEVADEVGFYDAAYFSKQFKRYTNQTPKDYRKQIQGKKQ